jgi:hypothetical protein
MIDKKFDIILIVIAIALFICIQMLGTGWRYDRELKCEQMLKENPTLDRQNGG